MSTDPSSPNDHPDDACFGDAPALPDVVAGLAWSAPAAPPPHVKQALLARIQAAKAAQPRVGTAGWRFGALEAPEGWVPLRLPGVRIRELTLDPPRDTALLYVEMERGAKFPDHLHSGPERGLVLTGDLWTEGRLLREGDFYEAAAGTSHQRISSPSGCTGLLWVSAAGWQQWRTAMAAT